LIYEGYNKITMYMPEVREQTQKVSLDISLAEVDPPR